MRGKLMDTLAERSARLARICMEMDVAQGVKALGVELARAFPDWRFCCVLSRGGWHRLGGVVDANYRRVSDNIVRWAERESGGDVDELVARYLDAGFFATHLVGRTHYFTAPTGDSPGDFVQLEVEELREVLNRRLVQRNWFPDSIDEFLDPLDYPRLEPEPVAEPRFLFRRITPISRLLDSRNDLSRWQYNLRRFFHDWHSSSAFEGRHFCRHWVLALQAYTDSDGECRLNAKPVTTYSGKLPDLPGGGLLSGAELANALHDYDRRIGFPFAWFFMMLSCKAENYALAKAVLRDQMGAFDYLACRDLKVLRSWEERPYSV